MTDRLKIDGLKPYLEYKESGQEWLGMIPAHWGQLRAKYLFREVEERSETGREELLSVSHLTGVTPRSQKTVTMFLAKSNIGNKICRPDDVVINTMWAWMGALGVARHTGMVSPSYGVYRPLEDSGFMPRYADHLLRTPAYVGEYQRRSTGVNSSRLRLYPEQFLRIPVVIPPLEDQVAIVRFLDRANGQIERAVRIKKKLIALLNEQKQAIIHRAVTRGLVPTVPIKPSGIPLLGEIPRHWEVNRLRHLVELIVSNVDKHSHKWEEAVRLCNYTDVYKNEIITDHIQFMQATATKDEIARFRIRIGDVIITKDSEEWDDIGVPSLVGCEAVDLVCGYHLAILRPDTTKMIGKFLLRVLQDKFVATQMHVRANGVTRYGLSHNAIKDVLLPVPSSVDEQERICSSLSRELLSLDTTMAHTEVEIALLREYRMRLMADVVTGKLDVREAVKNLPMETEEPPIELEPEEQIEEEITTKDE